MLRHLGLGLLLLSPWAHSQIETEKSLDLEQVKEWSSHVRERQAENLQITDLLPTDIQSGSDGEVVGRKVLERGLASLGRMESFKNHQVVQAVDALEQGTQISSGSNERFGQQNFRFQLRPAQTRASVRYQGFIDAEVTYHLDTRVSRFEWKEDLGNRFSVGVNLESSSLEKVGRFETHWSW